MAEVPTFFSSLVGGVVGAVAAVDVPAEGERRPRPAPGTDWSHTWQKLSESGRELDGFVQQLTFIVGKVAGCLRCGSEHLCKSLSEGRAPSACCLMDKSDVDQSIDSCKQGAEFLLRGGRLVLEAILEGAKVVATRSLLAVEGTREVVLRNIPYTQEKISQTCCSFMKGYKSRSIGSSGGGYSSSSYQQSSYQQPSYGAPPSSSGQPSTGFFW